MHGVRSRLHSSPGRRVTPRRRSLGSRISRRGHLNRSAGGRHLRGQTTPVLTGSRSTCVSPSFRAAGRQIIMEAKHRSATVVAVRMAGQTADTRRDRTAAALPIAGPVAVVGIKVPARLTADPVAVVAAGTVEVAVLPIADPAAVAVVAVHAEEAAVRAEEAVAVLRMRPRHMVAVEGPIGKIVRAWACPSRALPFTGYRFVSLGNDSDSTPTKFEPILRKALKPGAEACEIRIKLAGTEELQQS